MLRENSFDPVEAGRSLGHDLYRWQCRPRGNVPPSVNEGFVAVEAAGTRQKRADRFVRKWLQLREGALRRGRVINDDVTPDLLRQIDVARCPVTRVLLTHGELSDTDASVDRLNNDGAYAANNLAVMSTGANRAKGARDFAEVLERSGRSAASDGLLPVEWLRMAALMLGPCFAASPASAPVIALAAPIPLRSVRTAVQQIQHVFTLGAGAQSGKNALVRDFRHAASTERSLTRLRTFAEAMHQGLKGLDVPHDAWLQAGVMPAFVAWRQSLDDDSLGLAGEIARRRAQARVVPPARIDSWRLAARGYHA